MQEEELTEYRVAPNQLFRRFLQSVGDGHLARELSDDCILSFFGRIVKGSGSVLSYLRTQIVGRYNHTAFLDAQHCNEADELLLKERFARSFQLLRKRATQPRALPTSMRLRAESDEEEEEKASSASCINQLLTPPRSSTLADREVMHYIAASGSLQASHKHNDGGIDLGENSQVSLTLGYCRNSCVYKDDTSIDICLIVYEKLKPKTRGMRYGRMRSARNVLTDDEGEVPAPSSVRRMLFSSNSDGDCECDEDSVQPATDGQPSHLLPRKRQHKGDSSMRKPKRLNVFGAMRF